MKTDYTGIVYPVNLYDFEDKEQNVKDQIDYMLARTQRIFEYEGLPDTIPKRSLELMLQTCGYVAITKVEGELYAFWGGLGGTPDAYYMPTIFTVANPALNYSANLEIGKDCEVIRNDTMYKGLIPLMSRYATGISENDLTMRLVDIMARVNTALTAETDRDLESARTFLSQIVKGKLSPMASTAFLDGVRGIPMTASGNAVSMTDLIEYEQYLRAGLFNELGINASYNMKREALNSNETAVNSAVLFPFIDDMLACRQECLEKVNAMFGTNITVRLSGVWEDEQEQREAEEVDENEKDTTSSDSAVDDAGNYQEDGAGVSSTDTVDSERSDS